MGIRLIRAFHVQGEFRDWGFRDHSLGMSSSTVDSVAPRRLMWSISLRLYMSHSLNSLKGGYMGDYILGGSGGLSK